MKCGLLHLIYFAVVSLIFQFWLFGFLIFQFLKPCIPYFFSFEGLFLIEGIPYIGIIYNMLYNKPGVLI